MPGVSAIERLCRLATHAEGLDARALRSLQAAVGNAAEHLSPLFTQADGLFAFDAALHVFASTELAWWNDRDTWRAEYEGMADDAVFFAEDVFGGQFCVRERAVGFFDPESGSFDRFADDIFSWAERVLEDPDVLTGRSIAEAWRELRGPISPDARLVPKVPFILGGDYSVDNLAAIDRVRGMRFRGSLAVQLRDVPDGSQVRLRVLE
jgi:hypothetical protein